MKLVKYIILALGLVAGGTSCNDFLDEKPNKTSSIDPTHADQLEYLFNNYYSFYSESNRALLFSTDDYGLLTELIDAESSTYGVAEVQFATWDYKYLPTDWREWYWGGEYSKIFTANYVLNKLSSVSGTSEQKNKLRLEAHFIRAYSLWNLAQIYCLPYTDANKNELGLVLKKTTSFEESTKRATLEETYKQIELDLAEALKIEEKLIKVSDKKRKIWRASKSCVNAFAARYYLNRSSYARALEHAEVALAEYNSLVDYNVDMRYSSIPSTVNVNGVPVLVKFPYTHDNQSDMTDMLEWKEFYYFRVLSHESWWYIPSKELLNLYDKEYDLRYKYHMVENYSYDRGLIDPAYEYPGYIFFFKDRIPLGPTVAEMLITKAECLARDSKVQEAMNVLNQLRDKRFDANAPSGRKYISATDKQDAIKKISDERRREMPFSQRWYEIRRFNNNEDPSDDIGTLTRNFYRYNDAIVENGGNVTTYTLEKNSRRYAAPIPYTELQSSNGVIEQNKY